MKLNVDVDILALTTYNRNCQTDITHNIITAAKETQKQTGIPSILLVVNEERKHSIMKEYDDIECRVLTENLRGMKINFFWDHETINHILFSLHDKVNKLKRISDIIK